MDIVREIAKEKEYLITTRRHLHKHPEISFREYETAAFIEKQLASFGVASRRVNDTGLVGVIDGVKGAGKTVLLRADIDALPIQEETDIPYRSQTAGVMHACGHDAHTAALLGAAKILQSFRDDFAGRVLLVFQHAEEVGQGARYFLDEGIAEDVDRAFGIHILPTFPAGEVALTRGADAASCDFFTITVRGKAAHISKPHQGIDAAHIAARIAIELKTLVPSVVNPMETALVGVGKIAAGSAYNIIAEDAVLEGTIRAFSDETQILLRERVETLAEDIAASYGGVAVTAFDHTTSVIINDDEAFDEVYAVACKVAGVENVITDRPKLMGLAADDFSEFLRKAKGVYAHIGTENEKNPNTQNPLHSSCFDIDESVLPMMTRLHAEYALSILTEK